MNASRQRPGSEVQAQVGGFLLAGCTSDSAGVADPALNGRRTDRLAIHHNGGTVPNVGFRIPLEALGGILCENKIRFPAIQFPLGGMCVANLGAANHGTAGYQVPALLAAA